MYTLIHRSYLNDERILNLVRKFRFLKLKAALIQENFFNSNIRAFKKFRK